MDVSICQEQATVLAVKLLTCFFCEYSFVVNLQEDLLCYLTVNGTTSPSKVIKRDIEPVINLLMHFVKLVTYLLRTSPLL